MRPENARARIATAVCLVLLLALAGCATVRPVVQPRPWDRHADSGPLRVYGADPASPGQQLFQALAREPSLATRLGREGEPDTLEVVGSRWAPKQIVLTYTRRGAGRPRRIVLDPTEDGFAARASEPIAAPPSQRARGRARARKPAKPAAAPKDAAGGPATPTARQQLECPIDASRPDCQALCSGGASYEWCR